MKKKLLVFFQKMSKAFLLPITLLAFAAMLLGLASVFLWHDQLKEMMPFIASPGIQYAARVINTVAGAIMDNLPVLFAISLALGLANEDKEYAVLSGLVGYLAFLMGMSTLLQFNPNIQAMFPESAVRTILGIQTLDTGILGGIIVGILTAIIHNKTHRVQLPMVFSFFSGTKFVPIACVTVFVILGQVFPFVWVVISKVINSAALAVANSGIFGPFIYAFGERLLIPTGLHHVWNTVIRDTAVSGTYMFEAGKVIEGARPAFNLFLETNTLPINVATGEQVALSELVKFLRAGQVPMTMFALPAIALAMYNTAYPENRRKIKQLLITGVCTALLAGITEPLEFAFLFAAPILYLIYSALCGVSFVIVFLLGNQMGGTEPSLIGLLLYGLLRPESKYYISLIIGCIMAVISYVLFKWYIIKFDVKTPGRGGEYDQTMDAIDTTDDKYSTNDPLALKAQVVIEALGGKVNIRKVDCCMTRLRVVLNDMSLVDENKIRTTGCMGVVKPDNENIQIIYGTTVELVKGAVNKQLSKMTVQ